MMVGDDIPGGGTVFLLGRGEGTFLKNSKEGVHFPNIEPFGVRFDFYRKMI